MEQNNFSILSTRPLANETMLKAAAAGVALHTESFIETRSIINPEISQYIRQLAKEETNVVFTSMNAADAVIACLQYHNAEPEWTIYTMGGTTRTVIKNYFTNSEINGEATNSTELARAIVDDNIGEIVFFCGNQRRDELPTILQEENIVVIEEVVYETREIPVTIEKDYSGILFFSPSAVRSFFSTNKIGAQTVLFAIGTTTAHELRNYSSNKILVSEFPDKEQLAAKAIEYFSKATTS